MFHPQTGLGPGRRTFDRGGHGPGRFEGPSPCIPITRSPRRPLQRYRDYARQRQMTLGDLLLENRIIFLEGVINDAVANER